MLPLSGKKAIVTGGTRGIGEAIARRLQADGAHVLITGVRPGQRVRDGFEQRTVDLAVRQEADVFAEELAKGGFDILINNAGINKIGKFSEIDPVDFDRIQEVNVHAPFRLCQAVIPGMANRNWGRIVNVTSIFGVISKEYRASYSASKFALDGLTAALAAEVAAQGILANCVAPGFIGTDMTREILGEEGIAKLAQQVPMRRLGQPEEVAALVAWLAGPENTFVSGQNIIIDGGFSRV
jgi:NAD(P)-dependent dehydrogenase (short-subunit alcohol dehydrogenase family)